MSTPPSAAAPQTDGGDDGAPLPKLYFCHQCNRNVTVVLPPSSDPVCPDCDDGFLEELENPNPNLNPNPVSASVTGPGGLSFPDAFFPDPFSFLPFLFPSSSSTSVTSSSVDLHDPSSFSTNPSESPLGGQEFNPMLFLHNYLNNLRSSGAQVQFIIENRGGEGGPGGAFGGPVGNLGDYFIGPGLEQLIQQLAENDPNRYGTPPASKSAVENLPMVTVSEELTKSENNQCAICQDYFEIGMEVKQMPCKHVYHPDCLLPWLELHNSCPVCRHELPTDDSEYENQRDGGGGGGGGDRGGGGSGGFVGSGGGGAGERTLRRSFSIMLPFPFSSGGNTPGN
ncbi:hypothetical protein MLD38_011298 [Melastoma candidum]|uniref:Uncharacterized protein n=1 Tax=Melastoma candidum TaxID=119954 RepID=A0ACB9R2P6_9MYRT|nr:hypothetical protein MLD38_011298 [Melastoma candidum]